MQIIAHKNWNRYLLDVKFALLNGPLEEEAYVHQPQGFEKTSEKQKVCMMKKVLYVLKQALRA